MTLDYVVDHSCQPKLELGNGDDLAGTDRISHALKARDRAAVLAEFAPRDVKSPDDMEELPHKLVTLEAHGKETQWSRADLLLQAEELATHQHECARCPANFLRKPFGCFGLMHYPIARRSEEWLMERVQPADTFCGELFLDALQEFNHTGGSVQKARAGGLFAARDPVKRIVKRGWVSSLAVTSDQLFEALFFGGQPLDPDRLMSILLWLGGLRLYGELVRSRAQVRSLLALAMPGDRSLFTACEVGPSADEPAVASAQDLLRAFHVAWVNDVGILRAT